MYCICIIQGVCQFLPNHGIQAMNQSKFILQCKHLTSVRKRISKVNFALYESSFFKFYNCTCNLKLFLAMTACAARYELWRKGTHFQRDWMFILQNSVTSFTGIINQNSYILIRTKMKVIHTMIKDRLGPQGDRPRERILIWFFYGQNMYIFLVY